MQRFTRTVIEALFLTAVVIAVGIDSALHALAGKGLVERDEQTLPAAAK